MNLLFLRVINSLSTDLSLLTDYYQYPDMNKF